MESLEIFPLLAFEDNYIWCLRRNGNVAVIDPGDAAPVLKYLAESGDRLCAILVTHHHRDHIGGISELAARHPAPVFAPAVEHIAGTTHPLSGGQRIEIPELDLGLDVLDIAGHTRGHLGYYGRGSLFCGDTLFACGCGKLFEGKMPRLHAALKKIAALPPDTLIYCAHEYTMSGIRFARVVEPDNAALEARGAVAAQQRTDKQPTVPFTLADELATNPFLRCNEPGVIASAAKRLGRQPADELEVFTALRQWRDRF